MSEPFGRTKKFSQELGDDPIEYLVLLYVRFLQGLFNFREAQNFHWELDDERTEILIRGDGSLDLAVTDKKPLLSVAMGPYQFGGIGLDQLQQMNLTTHRRVKTDLISGHFIVYCVARNDIVASKLGFIVGRGTREHQRLLEGPGGFHQIARPAPSVGQPTPPGALGLDLQMSASIVQVNIPFHFQWTWTQEPGRQLPQHRSIDMILKNDRAADYPYVPPERLEKVELAVSDKPAKILHANKRRLHTIPNHLGPFSEETD